MRCFCTLAISAAILFFLGGDYAMATETGGGTNPSGPLVPPSQNVGPPLNLIPRKQDLPGKQDLPILGDRPPNDGPPPTKKAAEEAQAGGSSKPSESSACTTAASGGNCCDYPHWINTARSFIDTHEGSAANGEDPTVLKFHAHSGFAPIAKDHGYKTYETEGAWCGSFVHWCMTKTTNPKTTQPYPSIGAPYRASSWKSYGQATKQCFGAIMAVGKSHVTFCVGKTYKTTKSKDKKTGKYKTTSKEYYVGLGGNQGNKVKRSPYSPANLVFRLPDGYKPCKEHYELDKNHLEDYQALIAGGSEDESTR
jgi:hypothetical protein